MHAPIRGTYATGEVTLWKDMNITENNTEEYTIDEATGGPEGYERVYGNNSSIIGVWDHSRISRFYLSPTRHCVVDSGYGTYELNDDTISLTITNWYAYLNDFLENMCPPVLPARPWQQVIDRSDIIHAVLSIKAFHHPFRFSDA